MGAFWPLVRRALFCLSPETAHAFTVKALSFRNGAKPPVDDPVLAVKLNPLHLAFSNPVGLAAGFDKDAKVPGAMRALGFGFVEVGTTTPKPQAGNPRPRIFRLKEDRAIINRLGFNNDGHMAALRHLQAARAQSIHPIGVNIGANRDSVDRIADYVAGIDYFADVADYFTINISSPNTQGLRALQSRAALEELLMRLVDARARHSRPLPLLLKIAPDLTEGDREDIAEISLKSGIEGLIVSNTTISRPAGLRSSNRGMDGGLSGVPLFDMSTELLRQMYGLCDGKLILVGVGGVASATEAYAKIRAGASLVQLYTALIYQGPGLVRKIKKDLIHLLKRDGFSSITDAIGADHR